MLARTDLRAAALRIGARVAAFVLLLWLAFELAGYGLQAQNMAATAKLPTDAELERAFARGQAEFQRLVQMANEDANVWRIALDFAYADSKGVGERTVTADPNLPPTRWEEYRRIFRHLGLRSGLIRETISRPR